MRVLILGGTEFVGRAFVGAALDRGDEVTVLNRGSRAAPRGVRTVLADRRQQDALLTAVQGGARWDVVVDTWSWEPTAVRDAVRALEPLADRYVYVSSRSVYAGPVPAGADESQTVVTADPDDDDPGQDYARLKAGAELAVRESFGDRGLLLRPGLILGPHENIGRLPWWLGRLARGGEVAAPGDGSSTVQYVDARDLAEWGLRAAAAGLGGPFDVVTPPDAHTLGELLELCRRVTGSGARLRWIPEAEVLAAGVEPWTELPVWLPAGDVHAMLHEASASRAHSAGLTHRPLERTVADTWAWLQSIGGVAPQRPDRPALGLPPEKEARLLAGLP